jgi:uncharacterized protein YdeI (YjbR/CyaY-like superfamily)
MAPVIPNPKTTKSFRNADAFETWLARHHDRQAELWLRIYKKDSGVPTVTHGEALDVALCWGWIDGIRKGYDDTSFLQRFTPRKAKSLWSQNNRDHVARLIAAGRMTVHGQKPIDAAKADGRWDNAYAPARTVTVASLPADLRAAIRAKPRAHETLLTLDRQNLFALLVRTTIMKTAQGRQRKIAALVSRLERGQSILSPVRSPRKPAPKPGHRAIARR